MLIAVVGATTAGKSDLAVDLALELDGEVINADSMQLYRGMDIGTAKLTMAERRGVPHHLLDVWGVTQAASVAEYQDLADTVIGEIEKRGWSRSWLAVPASTSGPRSANWTSPARTRRSGSVWRPNSPSRARARSTSS